MQREIITINETLCDGCGLCVPNCPEGAIRVVDGKARLVGDIYCDGLGACLGNCPRGAISVETRDAEAYDERSVMENVIMQGSAAIRAHLEHLAEHGEAQNYREAVTFLSEKGIPVPQSGVNSSIADGGNGRGMREEHSRVAPRGFGGCPGSRTRTFPTTDAEAADSGNAAVLKSALTHWPVQMHLVHPLAPHYRGSDLLLAADCVAFSLGNFHQQFLPEKTLAIACPKLDTGKDEYREKLVALIDESQVKSITVMIMEVPCCGGLFELVRTALLRSKRSVPVRKIVVSVRGEILLDAQPVAL